MTQLNNHNVGSLSAAVETPTYDRQAVTPGIVHIASVVFIGPIRPCT